MTGAAVAGAWQLAHLYEQWLALPGLAGGWGAPAPGWRLALGLGMFLAGTLAGPMTVARRQKAVRWTERFAVMAVVWATGLILHGSYLHLTAPDGTLRLAGQVVWAALDGRYPPLDAARSVATGLYNVSVRPYVQAFGARTRVAAYFSTLGVPRYLAAYLWVALWALLLFFPCFYRRAWRLLWSGKAPGPGQGTRAGTAVRAESPRRARPDPKAFEQLIGVDEAVGVLKAQMASWVRAKEAAQFGVKPATGILLYGPPGTGKTSLARAAARYFGVHFMVVGPNDLLGRYVGESEQNVRTLFALARRRAPCVVFIDEIDALGRKRDGRHENRASDIVLPMLLQEMDGFQPLQGVLVIAATNRIDVLDEALVRRFTYKMAIGKPDAAGRAALLQRYLAGTPAEIDYERAAARLTDLAPADIEQICSVARQIVWSEYLQTGVRRPVQWSDLARAVIRTGR